MSDAVDRSERRRTAHWTQQGDFGGAVMLVPMRVLVSLAHS